MKFCQDFNFPNRRQECRRQSHYTLPRSARAESMIITNSVWRIAGICGLFAMSILASDPPSSDTTDNSQAGIAQNANEVSLKPPQPASGVSPAAKKGNEEKPQPNLEKEVVSEPFAEPTAISQLQAFSLIDEESAKSESPQPASGISPAPKKRNEEKPQPNLEKEVVSEPLAKPTPTSKTINSQAEIAQNANAVSLKPPQPANGLSPAPKKRNEEKPQRNLEKEVVSEPFAEPTPILQTVSSSATTIATVSAVTKPTPSQNVTINLINRLVE